MWNVISKFFEFCFLGQRPILRALFLGFCVFILQVALVIVAAVRDNSFYLPNASLGLFEHPGIWVILLGDCIFFLVVALVIRLVTNLSKRYPVTSHKLPRRYVRIVRRRLFSSLMLRYRDRQLFVVFTAFALMFWFNNAYQTLYPIEYYGNDLYDSYQNLNGYWATRLVLFTSWVIFLPYLCFMCLTIAYTVYRSANTLRLRGFLKYSPLHPDECGGFAYFGNLNLLFLLGLAVIYCELVVILLTHEKLNPGLVAGFVVASSLFLVSSFMVLLPVQRFLLNEKKRQFLRNYKAASLKTATMQSIAGYLFSERNSYSPYQTIQGYILWVLRAVPFAVAIIRLQQALDAPSI